jgi:hypothetical protein
MSDTRSVVFVGLPAAGKTTYLTFLYQCIYHSHASSLVLNDFADDRTYLHEMGKNLFLCTPMPRTVMGTPSVTRLSVTASDDAGVELRMPDYSGESWSAVLRERHWPPPLWGEIDDTDGVVFFININGFPDDPSLQTARISAETLGWQQADADSESSEADVAEPSQVTVVDLMQAIREVKPQLRRASLVLSAFDTETMVAPAAWVKMNAPLLQQYIRANKTEFDIQIFGVSAQGGDYGAIKGPGLPAPHERGWVRDAHGESVNSDAPVVWALGNG